MLAPRETLIVRESTSRSMRSNRSKETTLEINFRKALWAAGVRGYRKNVRDLPGCPDLLFGRKKLAVFLHGCYWHRCPRCRKDAPLKTNEAFWRSKLASNVDRDMLNEQRLRDLGFSVVVVWECDVRKDIEGSVRRVREALEAEEAFPDRHPSDNMDQGREE